SVVMCDYRSHHANLVVSHYSFVLLFFQVLAFFFFNDTATAAIYTLSLHDALPISFAREFTSVSGKFVYCDGEISVIENLIALVEDRKSTRLNSSHVKISYAVFCLKKKKKHKKRARSDENSLTTILQPRG